MPEQKPGKHIWNELPLSSLKFIQYHQRKATNFSKFPLLENEQFLHPECYQSLREISPQKPSH